MPSPEKQYAVIPNAIHRERRSNIKKYRLNTIPFTAEYRKNILFAAVTDIFSSLADSEITKISSAASRRKFHAGIRIT